MSGRKKTLTSEMFGLLKSVSLGVQKLDKKVDLHIQKVEFELKAIRELDVVQNASLEKHSARSDRLEKDNALREQKLRADMQAADSAIAARVEALEEPRKWLKSTWSVILFISLIVSGLMQLIEFLKSLAH